MGRRKLGATCRCARVPVHAQVGRWAYGRVTGNAQSADTMFCCAELVVCLHGRLSVRGRHGGEGAGPTREGGLGRGGEICPLGWAIGGAQLMLCAPDDADALRPLPADEVGEVLVGGEPSRARA